MSGTVRASVITHVKRGRGRAPLLDEQREQALALLRQQRRVPLRRNACRDLACKHRARDIQLSRQCAAAFDGDVARVAHVIELQPPTSQPQYGAAIGAAKALARLSGASSSRAYRGA